MANKKLSTDPNPADVSPPSGASDPVAAADTDKVVPEQAAGILREETQAPRPISDPFLDAQLRATGKAAASETASSWPPANTGLATTPAPRGGVGLFTVLIMSVLATGGGAVLALTALSQPALLKAVGLSALAPQPAAQAGGVTTALGDVAARLKALEGRVSQLEARTNPSPPAGPGATPPSATTPDTGDLGAELKGVAGRVTAIETRLAALDPTGAGGAVIAGLQSDIASLKALVQGLQSQAAQAPAPGVTFAVINLVEAASRPGPFWPEFETVRAAMPGTAEVAALEEFARKGVPTRVLLQERFAALGPAIEAADREALKQSGFWGWLKSFFSGLVRVEQVASVTGTSPQSSLLRAKLKLDQGDLSAAIEEVKAISPAPAVVSDWLVGAQGRLELEARVAALRGAVERGGRGGTVSPAPTPSSPVGIIPASPPANRATTGTAPQSGQGTLP